MQLLRLLTFSLVLFIFIGPSRLHAAPYAELKIFIDADSSFVTRAGGSEAAETEIIQLIAKTDARFRKQLGIAITIAGMHLWTESDPFDRSSQSTLLSSFSSYAEGSYRGSYSYDVAHLFVGSGLGGEGGVAYPGSACGDSASAPFAYGVSQPDLTDEYDFSVHLLAHELGHNLNAEHDSFPGCAVKTIMCEAQIGGTFSDASISAVQSYVQSRQSAGCFQSVERSDPVTSVRLKLTVSGSTVRYEVRGAENCTTLSIVGSPSQAGLSTIFGYLKLGDLTPGSLVSAQSKNVTAYRGSSSKLKIAAYCDGQLVMPSATLNSRKLRTRKFTSSAVLALRSLVRSFR